jgi:hypothetical protein
MSSRGESKKMRGEKGGKVVSSNTRRNLLEMALRTLRSSLVPDLRSWLCPTSIRPTFSRHLSTSLPRLSQPDKSYYVTTPIFYVNAGELPSFLLFIRTRTDAQKQTLTSDTFIRPSSPTSTLAMLG